MTTDAIVQTSARPRRLQTTPIAELRDVSVQFPRGATPALTGFSVNIGPQESVLLLGTSGSGKSTVLRALAGVVPHTIDAHVTGDIRVADSRAGDNNPEADTKQESAVVVRARHVAYVQQNPLDQLCMPTVRDEIAFSLENNRTPRADMDAAIDHVLKRVGARHLIDRATGTLSGGEGQRVAVASALVREPALLLLDEPTAMLDPAAARQIGQLLAHLRSPNVPSADNCGASLLVEHQLDEIGALPQTSIILKPDGGLLAQGPTEVLLREYAATLDEMGCWLPLRLRLAALHTQLGLAQPNSVATALQELATGMLPTKSGNTTSHASRQPQHPGDVVLRGEGLTAYSPAGQPLLHDADLTLHRGQVTAIIGRNGSGKSTLLRTLAGLTEATGTLENNPVGLVFQHPEQQFLTRSVRAEIGYGLSQADQRRAAHTRAAHNDNAARVTNTLTDFGLSTQADQDPFRLSGGQQRRLSLATMAVGDDDVLLLDEPTFGQDRSHAAAITAQITALARTGRAVVIVTHDLNMVAQIADQLLVLGEGRVLETGTPQRVLTDRAVMHQAGLELPAALAWCQQNDVPLQPIAQALR